MCSEWCEFEVAKFAVKWAACSTCPNSNPKNCPPSGHFWESSILRLQKKAGLKCQPIKRYIVHRRRSHSFRASEKRPKKTDFCTQTHLKWEKNLFPPFQVTFITLFRTPLKPGKVCPKYVKELYSIPALNFSASFMDMHFFAVNLTRGTLCITREM